MSDVSASAERAAKNVARAAENSPLMRGLARGGFAADGAVHILLGSIVIAVAVGARTETDQSGAFKAVASVPLGFVLLWVLAALMGALALYQVAAAILARGPQRRWIARLSHAGQALGFGVLAGIAAAVAVGARPSGDEAAEEASRGILSVPGGAFVLGAVGVVVAVAGFTYIGIGVGRSFRKKLTMPDGALGAAVTVTGVVGYVAKGAALVTVGALLLTAAWTARADAAGGLDAAIDTLLEMAAGPFLVAAIGAGFICFGVFLLFRARYERL